MNNLTRKKPAGGKPSGHAERRKIGRVVHDDRGNASVDWRYAPADFDRPVLEVLGGDELTIKSEDTHDPYARHAAGNHGPRTRTDLRKLSDWIKMMREREQRQRGSGGSDGRGESGG